VLDAPLDARRGWTRPSTRVEDGIPSQDDEDEDDEEEPETGPRRLSREQLFAELNAQGDVLAAVAAKLDEALQLDGALDEAIRQAVEDIDVEDEDEDEDEEDVRRFERSDL